VIQKFDNDENIMKINIDVRNKKMKIDIVKSKV